MQFKVFEKPQELILRHCLFSALLASILVFQATRAKAIDPATAGLIVEGVGFVTSALDKPQPNLTLEIVQRNRTLLIGMNTKLDQLGENLIKLYAAVGDIPAQLAEELDKERIFVQGVRATARGQTLLGYIEEFEGDLERYAADPTAMDMGSVRNEYYARLNTLEIDVTNIGNEIFQEATVKNVDAITLAIVAHAHLSTLTEINVRFDQRRLSRLEGVARDYTNRLNAVLSDSAETLSTWTKTRANELIAHAGWTRIGENFGLPLPVWDGPGDRLFVELPGQTFTMCIRRDSMHKRTTYYPAVPNRGEPASRFENQKPEARDFYVRTLRFGKGEGGAISAALLTEPSGDCSADHPLRVVEVLTRSTFTTRSQISSYRNTTVQTFAPEDCITACGLGADQSNLDAAMEQIHALRISTEILALVAGVRDDALAVRDGNLSGFQVSETLSSVAIYKDVIRDQLDAQERLQRLADVEALDAERVRVAREVSALIERQDKEIAELFDEAARAAKFNKALGYINLAAKVFHGWTKLDAKLSAGERQATNDAVSTAITGLQMARGREPANAAVGEGLKLMNNLLGLAGFYGDLEQARRAQVRFDQVYTAMQNSIPAGASQSFDMYVSSNDPMQFSFLVPVGDDVLLKPSESYLKRITIDGTGAGTGHRMEVHLDLRSN